MLDPICTVSDAAALGYGVTNQGLIRASTRVRTFTRQLITEGETPSVVLLAGVGPWRLPERPVIAVTAVVDQDGNAVDWELLGQMLSACAENVTVTFTHGWPAAGMPDGLVEAVARIALRLDPTAPASTGLQRDSTLGRLTVRSTSSAESAATGLTPDEERAIRQFYPRLPRTVRSL